jgi:hypothetical protein
MKIDIDKIGLNEAEELLKNVDNQILKAEVGFLREVNKLQSIKILLLEKIRKIPLP